MRTITVKLAALVGLALLTSGTSATFFPGTVDRPVYERVAYADCIVFGKVTAHAKDTVSATQYPGLNNKTDFNIATVKVKKVYVGSHGLTEIRIGSQTPLVPKAGKDGIKPIFVPGGGKSPAFEPDSLPVGKEGIFFLRKHFEEDFYQLSHYPAVLSKTSAAFAKEKLQVEHCVKLLADPAKSLKSKSKADRLLTAAMLIMRYRDAPFVGIMKKTEPIDAEESKKILTALLEADWYVKPPTKLAIDPTSLLLRLGLTQKDDYDPPTLPLFSINPVQAQDGLKKRADYNKRWVREHRDTYVIQRYVVEAPEKK
jgi:hypothetical protein